MLYDVQVHQRQFLLLRHFCRNGLLSLNFVFSTSQLNLVVFFENIFIGWSFLPYTRNKLQFVEQNKEQKSSILATYSIQGMRQHGCSGCTHPQIFGTSPFVPADFEASSTMCTCCFETQSSPGCTCTRTRRSKILTHSLPYVL